jgi:phosphatidylserine/phosphatidylglycerophosphate/cardiolipin synthase-like enzyme
MTSALCLLTSEDLGQLAVALHAGRLRPPFTPLLLRRYVPDALAGPVAAELQRRVGEGMQAKHLADGLELLGQDRRQRPAAEDLIDLVWTGPEAPGIVNRDTSVVVRELFQEARESVLVAGFVVYQGHVVFKELAARMDLNPGLRARMYLDIRRPRNDPSSPSELVRRFAEHFVGKEWPGRRPPELFFDPRSLEMDASQRASLHAKCVVVDRARAFVSSANFTRAAQSKNIEAGVLVRSPSFAGRLADHFEALAARGLLRPIPVDGPRC